MSPPLFIHRRVGKYGPGISSDQMFAEPVSPVESEYTGNGVIMPQPHTDIGIEDYQKPRQSISSRVRNISILSRRSMKDDATIRPPPLSVNISDTRNNSSPYQHEPEPSRTAPDDHSLYSQATTHSDPTSTLPSPRNFGQSAVIFDSQSSGRGRAGSMQRTVGLGSINTSSGSSTSSPPVTPISPSFSNFPPTPRSAMFQYQHEEAPASTVLSSRSSSSSQTAEPKLVRMGGRGGAGAKARVVKPIKQKSQASNDLNVGPLMNLLARTQSLSMKKKKKSVEHLNSPPLTAPPVPSPASAWPTHIQDPYSPVDNIAPTFEAQRRSLGSIAETNSVVSSIAFAPAPAPRLARAPAANLVQAKQRRPPSIDTGHHYRPVPTHVDRRVMIADERRTVPIGNGLFTPTASAYSLPETVEYDGDGDEEEQYYEHDVRVHRKKQTSAMPSNKFMRTLGEYDLSSAPGGSGPRGIHRPTLEPLHIQENDMFSHADAINRMRPASASSSVMASRPIADDGYDPSLYSTDGENTVAGSDDTVEAMAVFGSTGYSNVAVARHRLAMEFAPPTPPHSPLRNSHQPTIVGHRLVANAGAPDPTYTGPSAAPFSFYAPILEEDMTETETESNEGTNEGISAGVSENGSGSFYSASSSPRASSDRPAPDAGGAGENAQWSGNWNRDDLTDVMHRLRLLK